VSTYQVARDRAIDLWRRDAAATAWDSAMARLREQTSVSINEALLRELRGDRS
jgi:hypothetical protein